MKSHTSAASGRERPVKSRKKLSLIHGAILDCGSGFQPRITRSDKHILNVVSYEKPDNRSRIWECGSWKTAPNLRHPVSNPYNQASSIKKKRPEQPVSRILFPDRVTPHRATIIHLRIPVARHLVRPTRKLERAALIRFPIWSCTGWGLPSFPGHPGNWCALTAPFHPYRASSRSARGRAVYFLLHFPSCCHDFTL